MLLYINAIIKQKLCNNVMQSSWNNNVMQQSSNIIQTTVPPRTSVTQMIFVNQGIIQ